MRSMVNLDYITSLFSTCKLCWDWRKLDTTPYSYDKYLGIVCVHYYTHMITHGMVFVEPVSGTGWSKSGTCR